MAQGWHGNSEGHRKAGRLGGLRSAANRRNKSKFGERISDKKPDGRADIKDRTAFSSK